MTHPLAASRGKCAEPNEVAECALFLASKATFTTGTLLTVEMAVAETLGHGRCGTFLICPLYIYTTYCYNLLFNITVIKYS